MRWLLQHSLLTPGDTLDYGCGHGYDAARFGLDSWDPNWNPWPIGKNKWQTITCIYVLNVLKPADQRLVVDRVRSLLKSGGAAYFAVRRDVGGTKTQYDVRLNLPVLVRKPGAYEIYVVRKE